MTDAFANINITAGAENPSSSSCHLEQSDQPTHSLHNSGDIDTQMLKDMVIDGAETVSQYQNHEILGMLHLIL
jgi:hypothetical protein